MTGIETRLPGPRGWCRVVRARWKESRCKEIVPTCPLPPGLMSSVRPLDESRLETLAKRKRGSERHELTYEFDRRTDFVDFEAGQRNAAESCDP